MCFDMCIYLFMFCLCFVCVRSLSSEDHIIALVYTIGKYCVFFCEYLQCSKRGSVMRAHSLHMWLAPVVGQYTVLLIRASIPSVCVFSKNQQFAGDH